MKFNELGISIDWIIVLWMVKSRLFFSSQIASKYHPYVCHYSTINKVYDQEAINSNIYNKSCYLSCHIKTYWIFIFAPYY